MRLVIIESPYAGHIQANVDYARACVRDALLRGESPIASHLLYTQVGILNDNSQKERELGIEAGLAWRRVADASVVYTDRGISSGMKYGISVAEKAGIPVEYRTLKNYKKKDGTEHIRQVPRYDKAFTSALEGGETNAEEGKTEAEGT